MAHTAIYPSVVARRRDFAAFRFLRRQKPNGQQMPKTFGFDPSLTLTRMQYPAIVGNIGNRKPVVYAGYANPCNVQQPLTAHS
jgi:hypothetical protein